MSFCMFMELILVLFIRWGLKDGISTENRNIMVQLISLTLGFHRRECKVMKSQRRDSSWSSTVGKSLESARRQIRWVISLYNDNCQILLLPNSAERLNFKSPRCTGRPRKEANMCDFEAFLCTSDRWRSTYPWIKIDVFLDSDSPNKWDWIIQIADTEYFKSTTSGLYKAIWRVLGPYCHWMW